ncbi:cupin domain-containing protein [Thiocystis violacea]|uniref:cupin domain-containing protein n=1 Tax=Thiocystis violacea TaxID=13725 RepID=UPI001908CEAF|nr:cupin domain-containing protein [Thiocystis violacea]MBK1716785.1 cupin [Thiocystis violacea]
MSSGNLFENLPEIGAGEVFEDLLRCRNVSIERIVSSDRPDPTLYDQIQDEWVCLLQGWAELWIDGETLTLRAGDYRFIPARVPHRVLRTSSEPCCVWLAIHIHPDPAAHGDG